MKKVIGTAGIGTTGVRPAKSKSINLLIILGMLMFVFTACSKDQPESVDQQSANEQQTYRIGIVYFGPDPAAETAIQGLLDGLKQKGFEEGKNLEVQKAHAQGEIGNIPMLFQNYDSQDFDVIIPMSTPCLTAACLSVKRTPVVFMYVYDPVAAGAGKSFTDHLPNVTGVGSFPPIEDTVEVIKKLVPGVKAVGAVYNSSEANSRKVVEVGREVLKKNGIRFEEATVTNTSEVLQAAQAVASRDIQVFWGIGDNTVLQAFDGIVKAASDQRLPLIINDPEFVDRGALMAVGIGWYDTGIAASEKVARVLRGEKTAEIPFENVAMKKLVLNQNVAEELGVTFPPEMVQEAQQ